MNDKRIYNKIARRCPLFKSRYDGLTNLAETGDISKEEVSCELCMNFIGGKCKEDMIDVVADRIF
ncbi:MAG: hypothetical protein GX061_05670 [Eubacteriaceae bacterium]|jgi:hypothetical protein|nr:hypothetical protein [Eubacteriaceae bacterium]